MIEHEASTRNTATKPANPTVKPATVRSFRSHGLSRTMVDEFGYPRVFYSTLEWETYLAYRWRHPHAKVRTQVWLTPPAEVDAIAEELGVRKPRKSNRVPTLSTDIVMTTAHEVLPIACKYAAELDRERVMEKLRIEARYWERRGHQHLTRTERDLPRTFVRNLLQAYHAARAFDSWPLAERQRLLGMLRDMSASARMQTVSELTARLSARVTAPPGTATTVLWASIWHGWLQADLKVRVSPMTLLAEFLVSV